MHPLIVIFVLLAAAMVWLIGSFLYKPIGRFFGRLVKDAKEAIEEEDKTETNETNKGD
jgi:hypothetical protein